MAKLSAQAQRLFDHLPEDGTKIGGITIQRELELSKVEYQRARHELQNEGLAMAGKGRGGSLARIEGKEPEKAPSPQERMALAREAKQANSVARKEMHGLMEKIVAYFHNEGFTQVQAKDVNFSQGRPVAAVWKGGKAKMYGIPQLEYDKMRAI